MNSDHPFPCGADATRARLVLHSSIAPCCPLSSANEAVAISVALRGRMASSSASDLCPGSLMGWLEGLRRPNQPQGVRPLSQDARSQDMDIRGRVPPSIVGSTGMRLCTRAGAACRVLAACRTHGRGYAWGSLLVPPVRRRNGRIAPPSDALSICLGLARRSLRPADVRGNRSVAHQDC